VSWSKQAGKWEAYATKERKKRHLGLFSSEEAADRAARAGH
jgi:hypothetical protein